MKPKGAHAAPGRRHYSHHEADRCRLPRGVAQEERTSNVRETSLKSYRDSTPERDMRKPDLLRDSWSRRSDSTDDLRITSAFSESLVIRRVS